MFTFIDATMSATRLMSATQLQEVIEEARRNSLTPVRGAEPDFGQRLKAATQRRLAIYRGSRIHANVSAEDESFGEKLKRAVQRHPRSKESAGKNAEKERSRYHPPKRRPATKSD